MIGLWWELAIHPVGAMATPLISFNSNNTSFLLQVQKLFRLVTVDPPANAVGLAPCAIVFRWSHRGSRGFSASAVGLAVYAIVFG